MKIIIAAVLLTIGASTSFAGESFTQILEIMNNNLVQNALKDQSISSMTIKYDQLNRAGFNYTLVVCSAGYVNQDGSSSEDLVYVVTNINGAMTMFPPSEKHIVQDFSEEESDECKNIRLR